MKLERYRKLTYGIGQIGSEAVDDVLVTAPPDGKIAGELNREIVATMLKFAKGRPNTLEANVDTTIAAMHGLNTIMGTLLLNMPRGARIGAYSAMRKQVIEMLDEMSVVVLREEDD